jgi:hypothetical protein
MGMSARRGAGRIFAAVVGFWLLGASAAMAATPDFTGKWLTSRFIGALKTTKGALPPLRPETKALYDKRVADRAAGRKVGDPLDDCVPHGVPRLMYAPYPMLIVQDAKDVSIIQQANHTVRMIYISGTHPEDGDPKWLGHSTGRWEGQTLVVDTVQFNDKTWLDKAGLPHSDQLKVTERFKLLPGGKTLQDRITIDDPKDYTAPWSTVVTFNKVPGMALAEQVCGRDHKM